MTLYFITGNKGKLEEAKKILPEIKNIDLDLPEIQELDPHKIIEEKLIEACKTKEGEFFCEDVSFSLDCMNGFPGPLIKWVLKSIGPDGIYDIAKKYDNFSATIKAIIGYSNGEDMKFFEGEITGTVVPKCGENGFGFDFIFKPKGYDKAFSEMTKEEKNKISMRKIALEKLKAYLDNRNA